MTKIDANLVARAKSAVISRDFKLAARLYRNILKSDPTNVDIMVEMADSYVKSGSDKKALETYQSVVKRDPQNFKALNSLGGIYRRLGDYKKSIEVLERASTFGGNLNTINYNMGHTYKLMGDYDNAIDCFEMVIDENPNDVLAYNHLGSIYAIQEKHKKALSYYARALQVDSNHPILHYNAALSYESLGNYKEAKKSFENALRSKPGWVDAMDSYAQMLLKINKSEAAESVLKHAVLLHPSNLKMKNDLASIYLKDGNLDESEKLYAQVLEKDEFNKDALKGIGSVHEKKGNALESAQIMEKLVKMYPESIEISLRYAKALMDLNRMHDAGVCIKKVRNKDPSNIEALNILSQYFIRKGQLGKTRGCYRRIAELDPFNISYLRDGAIQLTKVGDYERSDMQLKKYLERKPSDAKAWAALGENSHANGNWLDALEAYKKSLALQSGNRTVLSALALLSKKLTDNSHAIQTISHLLGDTDLEAATENLDSLEESILKRERIFSSVDASDSSLYGFSDNEDGLEDIDGDFIEADEKIDERMLELGSDIEESSDLDLDELLKLDVPADIDDFKSDEYESLELEESDIFDDDVFNAEDDVSNAKILDGLVQNDDMPIDTDLADKNLKDLDPFDGNFVPQEEPVEDQEYLGVDGDTLMDDFLEDSDEGDPLVPVSQPSPVTPPPAPVSQPSPVTPPPAPVSQSSPVTPPPAPLSQSSPVTPLSGSDSSSIVESSNKALNESEFLEDEQEEINLPFTEDDFSDDGYDSPIDDEYIQGEGLLAVADKTRELPDEDSFGDLFLEDDEEEKILPSDEVYIDDSELEHESNFQKELTEEEVMMEKVRQVLHELWAQPPIKPFYTTTEMFSNLRDLCRYLPEEKYGEFMNSLERMKLYYVISRLSGKPGLLSAAQTLRKSGVLGAGFIQQGRQRLKDESIKETFGYMTSLLENLADKGLASSLNGEVQRVIKELDNHS